MFHFNFDVDDRVHDVTALVPPLDRHTHHSVLTPQQTFSEIDLDTLLDALPSQISYSFISPPSASFKLARRDLFDARFQLISEGTGDPESDGSGSDPNFASALQFIDNPADLVPLVYEGGLKTWECSLDLAECLGRDMQGTKARGKRVLELGCGTAIPTLCILRELFSCQITEVAETHIHLQDYNASVLQLVTMPNIVLAWYTSSAAATFRSSEHHTSVADSEVVHVTPELIHAFKTALHTYRLHLRFFSGSWETFDLDAVRKGNVGGASFGDGVVGDKKSDAPAYHIVVTSETIYHLDALPSLVRVLREASSGGHGEGDCICLVAGKTVYFGVGGGVIEFVRSVESVGGRVETVWETSTGVSRKVMRVRWS